MTIPNGSAAARPFLPSKDFDVSRAFYEALGFEKRFDGEGVAVFAVGSTSFILQRHYNKEWAENFMMQLMVEDLEAWWAHIERLNLPAKFGVKAPSPPKLQPWGLRITYVFDPAGVLWHVAQEPASAPGR